ncbi:MAG TPA: hypothetical protein VK324_17120 [Tepidisphaeraceae bacterium]|nr:hypothetical protein [Tepidisphaeraceae bacterium]
MSLTIAFLMFVLTVLASFAASLRAAHAHDVAADAGLTGAAVPPDGETGAFDGVAAPAFGYDAWSDVVDAAAAQPEFTDDDTPDTLTYDTFDADVFLTLPAPAEDDEDQHARMPQAEAA